MRSPSGIRGLRDNLFNMTALVINNIPQMTLDSVATIENEVLNVYCQIFL